MNPCASASAKLLFVELNEFNPDMVRDVAHSLGLKNLTRLLSMVRAETRTEDEIEHQGLDPWVQWVSIHSGVAAWEHGVRRLAYTAKQSRPQIWDVLGAEGRRWGAWGVMNAPRGSDPNCAFFMPDPWSFEEVAYPAYLNRLLALPRYAAKNYLEFEPGAVLAALFELVRYFAPPTRWAVLMRSMIRLVDGWRTAGANVHTLTTLVDYIGVLTFVELRRQYSLDFSVIFLNHIAHLQHQFWRADGIVDPNMAFGLKLSDEMIGLLYESLAPDEALLVANGMRQKNVDGQGWCIFRQKNPKEMLQRLNITDAEVEQCMTNDANLLFASSESADSAAKILASCVLGADRERVFYLERESETRLFYQMAIEHRVEPGAIIMFDGGSIAFDDVIELVCERTGAHEQIGDVFMQGVEVPARLANHELFDVIRRYFGSSAAVSFAAA